MEDEIILPRDCVRKLASFFAMELDLKERFVAAHNHKELGLGGRHDLDLIDWLRGRRRREILI